MGRRVNRARRNIRWIEQYCRVPDGEDVGKPVRLRAWQRRELEKIYNNPHGTRRALLSFGRKNAKTTLSAMIVLLHLCGPEARVNGQLYSAAQSRDQAAILFSLACKIVRFSPDLLGVIQIRDSAKELLCPELGTKYKALSAEHSTAYGLSPVLVVHDELGQVRGSRSPLYEALETAVGAQESPLSIVISTQAPNDDDLLSVLIDDALAGHDPRVVVSLHTAPMDADPFSKQTIRKANPALGDFLNEQEVMAMAEDARRMPSREAEYRNLVLNQRVELNEPYVTKSVWDACSGRPADDWQGREVFAGLDLSATQDLTAFVRVSWSGQLLEVRATFWLPEHGLKEKSRTDRQPYDLWRQAGHLETTPGASVDYDQVAPIILATIRTEGIRKLAFDRWNIRFLRPALERAGASPEELELFEEFGQGFQSMSPALRSLDEVLLNARLRHGGNPVLEMCAKNAVVKSDPAGNRKLVKLAPNRRIDGMVALAMSVAMAGEPAEETKTATFRARLA